MDDKSIAVHTLRRRMFERDIKVGDLARASGLYMTDLSNILRGSIRLGPVREAKLARGIIRLGLDRDVPAPEPTGEPVVIRIRPL